MFTNEFEWDETIITVMDETGDLEDIHIIMDDDGIYIRQFNEELQSYELITFNHDMFRDFNLALDSGEGTFKVE
jgi:hypothetical protein